MRGQVGWIYLPCRLDDGGRRGAGAAVAQVLAAFAARAGRPATVLIVPPALRATLAVPPQITVQEDAHLGPGEVWPGAPADAAGGSAGRVAAGAEGAAP